MPDNTSNTALILVTEKDWDAWISLIHTAAMKFDLWEYINPSTPKALLPVLSKPSKPTPGDVRSTQNPGESSNTQEEGEPSGIAQPTPNTPDATIRLTALTPSELSVFEALMRDFEYERRQHDRRIEAMAELCSRIQSSVHKDHILYTENCNTAWEMLTNLKRRFAPSDKARELNVTFDWAKATKKITRGTNIEKWVQDFESAYNKAIQLSLPEIQGLKPHYLFANAIKDQAPTFAETLELRLIEMSDAQANTMPFKEEIRKFRNL